MPIYEFSCLETGEVVEKILPLSESYKKLIICPIHTQYDDGRDFSFHNAERVWSKTANLSQGKPTIIFRNPKTGEVKFAASSYDKAPVGFEKEELKSTTERSKFENEQNKKYAQEDEVYNMKLEMERSELQKQRHDQINAEMSSMADKSDNPLLTKNLMKAAMERNRKKTIPKKRKTVFKLDVNHIDKSNL